MTKGFKSYHIVTFGCQMNVHESEKIAGILEFLNYQETLEIEKADVIVLNTCCIRDTAENKAFGKIGSIKAFKKNNPNLILVVLGCMPQQKGYADKIKNSYPYVDIVLGTASIDRLLDLIPMVEKERRSYIYVNDNEKPDIVEGEKIYRTSGCNAWVNITYGCNNFCTYCIVPHVRGRERSREFNKIIEETKDLIAKGYKEITFLGQNVNSYGHDLKDGSTFAKLLKATSDIEGKFRIRFMTSHPKDLSDDVIDVIAGSDKICKCIHLPIQAGSDNVLKLMNRHYTKDYYLNVVKKIRTKIKDCALTTDIMVGFPNESEEDFLQTVEIAKTVRYQNAFTFIYSKRVGTKAAEMEQIPYEIKSQRIQRLIKVQNEISDEIAKETLGKVFEVLLEDKADKEGYLKGRSDCNKLVTVKADDRYLNKFVNVKITKTKRTALYGEIVNA